MGTTLFEVYLVLKRFALLGSALSPETPDFKINHYPEWFTTGVTHWLDISVYKALIRFVGLISQNDKLKIYFFFFFFFAELKKQLNLMI